LTSQMRRCSCSVASNIAEGCGRGGDADLGRFLQIAMGSASELEYQLLLSHDLGLVSESEHQVLASQATEVKRMLTALLQKLKADS
jgi:four helix bundle protein